MAPAPSPDLIAGLRRVVHAGVADAGGWPAGLCPEIASVAEADCISLLLGRGAFLVGDDIVLPLRVSREAGAGEVPATAPPRSGP